MTSFRFRLEKALGWRRLQLELEETQYKTAAADVGAMDRALADLRAAAGSEESALRGGQPTIGLDWSALGSYRIGAQRDEKELARQRVACVEKLVRKQAEMLAARQRCRLLEMLKERRLAEWEAANNRELDELAAESYGARWNRLHAGRSGGVEAAARDGSSISAMPESAGQGTWKVI